jgi:hypothetical protein|tara:strand:- start:90 stop:461 length:372 start_codon:yes stop_codon:yes gene_type:complete
MATINIVDKDGNSIAATDATVPSDRHFRDAWSLSGSVITEDVAASKILFRDKIREVRIPLLDAQDVVYMRALEGADAAAQAASVAVKKALRDAPADSAIASASTITDLKAAWDTDVLGDSPYA